MTVVQTAFPRFAPTRPLQNSALHGFATTSRQTYANAALKHRCPGAWRGLFSAGNIGRRGEC